MYYSITFGSKNTWDDWKLIPTSRPVINPPPVRTKYVEIPGVHGQIDMTTMLTGEPMYGNRTGYFDFIAHSYDTTWLDRYHEIVGYLHGKHMRLVLEEDPLYFYEGRFTVSSWVSTKDFSRITIEYTLGPYKKLLSNPTGAGVI